MSKQSEKNVIPWIEVNCCYCSSAIGIDYKNAKSVSQLKQSAKNWKYVGIYGNLCPECYEKYKAKKKPFD
ncbi:hypothetical protein M2146_002533 [Lachnospiraceae bacterium PF1-22]